MGIVQRRTCEKCGQPNLRWVKIKGKWYLYLMNKQYRHVCSTEKPKEVKKKQEMKQCRIKSGTMRDVVWLDNPILNTFVTLKDSDDPKRLWKIEEVYNIEQTKEQLESRSYRKFKNNI